MLNTNYNGYKCFFLSTNNITYLAPSEKTPLFYHLSIYIYKTIISGSRQFSNFSSY